MKRLGNILLVTAFLLAPLTYFKMKEQLKEERVYWMKNEAYLLNSYRGVSKDRLKELCFNHVGRISDNEDWDEILEENGIKGKIQPISPKDLTLQDYQKILFSYGIDTESYEFNKYLNFSE